MNKYIDVYYDTCIDCINIKTAEWDIDLFIDIDTNNYLLDISIDKYVTIEQYYNNEYYGSEIDYNKAFKISYSEIILGCKNILSELVYQACKENDIFFLENEIEEMTILLNNDTIKVI